MINGSDGLQFPPFLSVGDTVKVYTEDLRRWAVECFYGPDSSRSAHLTASNRSTFQEIDVLYFTIADCGLGIDTRD